jgi:hypothetical protein
MQARSSRRQQSGSLLNRPRSDLTAQVTGARADLRDRARSCGIRSLVVLSATGLLSVAAAGWGGSPTRRPALPAMGTWSAEGLTEVSEGTSDAYPSQRLTRTWLVYNGRNQGACGLWLARQAAYSTERAPLVRSSYIATFSGRVDGCRTTRTERFTKRLTIDVSDGGRPLQGNRGLPVDVAGLFVGPRPGRPQPRDEFVERGGRQRAPPAARRLLPVRPGVADVAAGPGCVSRPRRAPARGERCADKPATVRLAGAAATVLRRC